MQLLDDIDRRDKNRSRFVTEAVRSELERRRREELRLSLDYPHPESAGLADEGFDAWAAGLPGEDGGLFDAALAKPVRWIEGRGWVEGKA